MPSPFSMQSFCCAVFYCAVFVAQLLLYSLFCCTVFYRTVFCYAAFYCAAFCVCTLNGLIKAVSDLSEICRQNEIKSLQLCRGYSELLI